MASYDIHGPENSGLLIPSLEDVVTKYKGYHIYLFNDSDFEGVSADLVINFTEYAQRIGDNSAIFRGINQESYYNSLRALFNKDPWYSATIGDIKNLSAGIFITKPSIQDFRAEKGDVFIYASQAAINDAYKDRIELSQDIVDLCRHNVDTFITRMIKYSRGCINSGAQNEDMLKTISKYIKLEPNINGLGFDFKPIVKKAFFHFHNDKTNKPFHDCVIYRF